VFTGTLTVKLDEWITPALVLVCLASDCSAAYDPLGPRRGELACRNSVPCRVRHHTGRQRVSRHATGVERALLFLGHDPVDRRVEPLEHGTESV